ncbi:hypothetical protein [Nocardia farcinica]|uniref:hypothetical protein n=1 Tax=Nocardia farcinica TaxID=37329 RepID=UPI0018955982|nr:hypothetical protein [Nocardia farcinica]MBF6315043.1 hypothetical protein [Nocardia farcinica]
MAEAGIERTIRMGSMAYVGADGKTRRADCGAVVRVHPDHVERFDRLNRPQEAASAVEPPARVEPPAQVERGGDSGEPSEAWTIAQLQAYADARDIDLGDATKKADILAAIAAAKAG